MQINKATQKAILSTLFYERAGDTPEGQPIFKPKTFPFDKLMDAASAAKKLVEGSEIKDDRIFYKDGEIELTPDERSILKDLFEGNKDSWDITVAEAVKELKDLFEGKG